MNPLISFTSMIQLAGGKIKLAIESHVKALFVNLDPVQDEPWNNQLQSTSRESKINGHFVFALLLLITIFIDGIFGLQYEHCGAISFRLHHIKDSPYIMLHQIAVKEVQFQDDMLMLCNTFFTLLVLAKFVFNWQYSVRFRLYPIDDGSGQLSIDSRGKAMSMLTYLEVGA